MSVLPGQYCEKSVLLFGNITFCYDGHVDI